MDKAPAEVWATILDEGTYLCSRRTMYCILEGAAEVRERRNQLRHPEYKKPELLAEAPNQIWSWDITKLLGPAKWTYFYLYVMLDIFSRYVVGWMVAEGESATLASQLIDETSAKQRIQRGQLTIHVDRGTSMKSKTVALLLSDLGVAKTHSRPQVSDETLLREPVSHPQVPPRLPRPLRLHRRRPRLLPPFFRWYNTKHRHFGIGLLTPEAVHYGRAGALLAERQRILTAAYQAHPERFVGRPPKPPVLPPAVWINPPKTEPEKEQAAAR